MSLDITTLRIMQTLVAIRAARPAGKGVKTNHNLWEEKYPFFEHSNAHYWTPFAQLGLPHRCDGIINHPDALPSVDTLSGRGHTLDLIANPFNPRFGEVKIGRKYFNGNDCWDLSTGREEFVSNLEWALCNQDVPDILLFNGYDHKLPNGTIGLFIDCINLSALADADGDDQFEHQVMFTKSSRRTNPTTGQVYHYRTLRIKPSAIATWKGRRQTNADTKRVLRDMGILTEPIMISKYGKTGKWVQGREEYADTPCITAEEFGYRIERVY